MCVCLCWTDQRFLVLDQPDDLDRVFVVVDVVGQGRQLRVIMLLGHRVMDRQKALEGGREG